MSEPRRKPRRLLGCMMWLVGIAGVLTLIAFLVVERVFNLCSNSTYAAFRDSTEPLEVRLADGSWKTPGATSVGEMDRARNLKTEWKGARWSRLIVRRQALTLWQKAAQRCLSAEVNVVEFPPANFKFSTSFREHFAVTTAKERLETEGLVFAITANFRDPKGKPLGLVYHEGVQRNPHFPTWTGYFFVKDGKPSFGPKSVFDATPGVLTEAAQGYPSVMKNHTVFSYVDLAPNKYFDGNKITYRSLAGMRRDGTIVFVLSGDGGTMNVTEVTALAAKLNIQHATLLDGGRALQYSLNLGNVTRDFHAYNTEWDLPWQELKPERSPVFIAVRKS